MKRLFAAFVLALCICGFARAEKVVTDIPYGSDPLQKLDVYIPDGVIRAPVIFMVHGGGWQEGDKANHNVVANKVPYFLGKGFVFVSVNYRLHPNANPLQEAQDVAAALAYFQQHATTYKANPDKIVLMGHSAGGNLVTLLAAVPHYLSDAKATSPIGVVVLDSAAYDVPAIMQKPHPHLYDPIFAHRPFLQHMASPTLQISVKPVPMLLICDTSRTNSCDQTQAFAPKAGAQVFSVNMSHADINLDVGLPDALTARIALFLGNLKANQ